VKIHRLRLRDFRGVVEHEVEFAPHGVTIVEGPNEVGKSSLAEAIELLFDERDDTAKQRVREIKPVDRDAGAEVEADVALGPYRFTYTKQFHRRSGTRLSIAAPRVETLTGREAHERVRTLLDEHVDVSLWRALRIVQGSPLTQPELDDAASLAAALDRAAGGDTGGEREQSLFDRARAEFELHFTATGRQRRPLVLAQQALAEAITEETALRERLDALERDVEAEAALRRHVAALEGSVATDRIALRETDVLLEAIQALREEALRLEARVETARSREAEAVQAARQRGQLVSSYASAQLNLENLAEELESEEPAHIAAGAQLRHVEERLEAALTARTDADSVVQRARRDVAFRRGERELAELRERSERVAHEREDLDRAHEVLAGPPIDELSVEAIQTAELAVERSAARLAAEGPVVQVRPEIDLELTADGRRERIPAGVAVEQRIAESWLLSMPGVGEVRVVAGAGVTEQRKILEQARTELRTLCVEADVQDHAGAVAALAARRAARAEIERSEQRLALALGNASPESLREQIAELEARIRRDAAARADEPPMPPSLEETERTLEEAESEASRARERAEEATRRREDAALRFQSFEQRRSDTRQRLDLADQSRIDLARRLAEAREVLPDETLDERRETCGNAVRELEAQAREASARLAERRPDDTEAEAAARRDALDASERALREQRDALLTLSGRLAQAGQDGTFERWQAARRHRARAERDLASRTRRADAAKRLFEALREEREAARSHYAAPLAAHIGALGRPLFGEDFEVEIGDDLRVVRRILAGRSLLESQLSAGAREQLGLLSRIAAARIAGDVPLWLDDALGHTDSDRLTALGPLLASAGESSQVIVLTCSPERFRAVPGARRVPLR
jgi:DNA repair exonuclease SbcCD ATPase subunit